jgi:bifunctional DNA-binding transcriptional regulator/antitoxin component of YhaV-PrlF toxin-antitoxin module
LYVPTAVWSVPEASLDDRGRLTLPKESRERYGERYHIVQLHDGIKLIPVADDPLAALCAEFADVEKTVEELRLGGRTATLDEAGR